MHETYKSTAGIESKTDVPIDLDAIEARIAAATPRPWTAAPNGHLGGSTVLYKQNGKDWPLPGCFHCGENDAVYEPADADLIAHAPEDLTALVAEVKRLRARDVLTTAVVDAARNVAVDEDETYTVVASAGSDALSNFDDLRAALAALNAGGA